MSGYSFWQQLQYYTHIRPEDVHASYAAATAKKRLRKALNKG